MSDQLPPDDPTDSPDEPVKRDGPLTPRFPEKGPPEDAPTDPPDEFVKRDGPLTPHFPEQGPPEWTNQPDVPEPFDPPRGGHYEARTFHKLGGRGRVWRAWDAQLKREVAFKEVRPRYANDPETLRRFVFEAEVTGRLDHPAVIPVYGFGHDAAGKPCYAMRFVEGKSLQEAITDFYAPGGPDGAERALALRRLLAQFVTVCRAVDYAHSRGVIHRDLKPANILVGDFGETLVVDWGAAKRVPAVQGRAGASPVIPAAPHPAPDETGHTTTGGLIGTPAYWAPEQYAADPDKHHVWTDVYGLGGILFAILTGQPPNINGAPAPTPPSARDRCPWVDAGLDAIARTALAFDPAHRYPSAAAVAEAVELWLADQPLVAQRTVVAGLERALAAHPDDHTLTEHHARQRANLGLMLAGMGRNKDAVTELKAAADAFGRLAASGLQPRFLADQASVLMSLSRAYTALDRPEMTRAMEHKAMDLCKRLVAEQPNVYPPDFAPAMLSGSQVEMDLDSELRHRADEFDGGEPTEADAPPAGPAEPPDPTAPLSQPDLGVPPAADPPATTGAAAGTPDPPGTPDEPSVPDISVLFPAAGGAPAGSFRAGDPALPDFELPLAPADSGVVPALPPRAAAASVTDSIPDIDSLFVRPPADAPGAAVAPGAFLSLASGYTWLRSLARGGMGRVYLARDEGLNRVVVIKTLADGEPTDGRAARRFRREVQITGSLEHPNLVRAYASGTSGDGRPYLVLEYLNGGTLVRQLDVYGPGWGPPLLDPLAQACDGLHFAHARNIVHRDAKLSNIMVLPTGRTVLLDWGLAKVVGQHDSLDSGGGAVEPAGDLMRSRAGALVGTPAYMSPEQARGEAAAIGPRTDVFTAGANLFHLVTGKPPGHRDDLRALIARRRAGDIPRLRDARPDVPKRLDDICARATAARPEHRYPTAAAFAADLRAFLAGPK
jgi:serine/threonine protein kinase